MIFHYEYMNTYYKNKIRVNKKTVKMNELSFNSNNKKNIRKG